MYTWRKPWLRWRRSSMDSLGERVAVAYGRELPKHDWKLLEKGGGRFCGYCIGRCDTDSEVCHAQLPDPENSSDDFMALLAWFESGGPDLMDIVRDSGTKHSTLAEWRLEVIEGILGAVE